MYVTWFGRVTLSNYFDTIFVGYYSIDDVIGAVVVMKSKLLCAKLLKYFDTQRKKQMTQTDKVEWVSSFLLKQFCLHALLFTVNSMMCYSQDCPLCLIFHMWPPCLSRHFSARWGIPLKTRRRSCLSSLRSFASRVILSCSSMRLAGGLWNTFAFRYPHMKKSKGIRSGDLGGHSTGWLSATILSPNNSCSRAITSLPLCGGVPSWAHHRCLNCPFCWRQNLSLSSRTGTTWSLIICRYLSPLIFCWKKKGPNSVPSPIMPIHTVSFCRQSFFS